ncbi:MAG: hypothetical protein J5811_08320 [Lachnospiraceae bacterium]|nr:hypothetical protein [Lachnospiraceae bacterium]
MKFPLLASVLVFVVWIAYEIKKAHKKDDKFIKDFWEREAEANATRRKSLADLNFVTIPLDELALPSDATEEMKEKAEILKTLSESKIVRLSEFTNTELKLKYGAPNLPLLTEWDNNYTLMVKTLQEIAVLLYKADNLALSEKYLNFAIQAGTDVSQTYFLLADIYEKRGEPDRITELELLAGNLNSIMRESILENLAEAGPHSDFLRNPY